MNTWNNHGVFEHNGWTYYSKSNYDPAKYTYNNMAARY